MFIFSDDYYFLALVHNFCKLFSLTNLATFTLNKMPANLPWPFVKTLPLFNSICLIKPLLLCINTFTCLKINQYSSGLFVSYSLKNPIVRKFVVPNVKMAQRKIRNCVSVWCLSVTKFHTKMGWWWTLVTDLLLYGVYLTEGFSSREVQKMIEEMEKNEPQWKNLPIAARNRILIKKWKDQAQVSRNVIQGAVPWNLFLTPLDREHQS